MRSILGKLIQNMSEDDKILVSQLPKSFITRFLPTRAFECQYNLELTTDQLFGQSLVYINQRGSILDYVPNKKLSGLLHGKLLTPVVLHIEVRGFYDQGVVVSFVAKTKEGIIKLKVGEQEVNKILESLKKDAENFRYIRSKF